ncbi:uncharacterized protein J3D65DRAFT_618845 [Phyllosticta citribraziliensis]|uniref:Secreted protein n=1 Tax=Phyllosticta citribraziliensis TaxID=989973 RepID=A0ABR1M0E5_9PEZI
MGVLLLLLLRRQSCTHGWDRHLVKSWCHVSTRRWYLRHGRVGRSGRRVVGWLALVVGERRRIMPCHALPQVPYVLRHMSLWCACCWPTMSSWHCRDKQQWSLLARHVGFQRRSPLDTGVLVCATAESSSGEVIRKNHPTSGLD